MMRNLTKLTQAIEELEVKTHRLVTSKTKGAKDVKIVKKKQTKKTTSNKIVPMKPTAYDTVIAIIFASSEDVSLDQIKKETGFDAKKISNIVYKAKKSGLIKSIKKVVYRKTGKTQFKNHQQKLYKQESKIEPKATEIKFIKKPSPPKGSQVTIDYTDASEWTKCSMCSAELKKKNLNKHLRKTHKKNLNKHLRKTHKKNKTIKKIGLLKIDPKPKLEKPLKKEIYEMINKKGTTEMLIDIVKRRKIQPPIKSIKPVYDDDK